MRNACQDKKGKKMRKTWSIFLLSMLMCGTLHAQHYLGVRGGWGGGSARFTPARETKLEWGLYSGGLSYKFYTAQKYVGGIQIDLQYMGRGFAYDLQSKSDSSYHRTINSFELPFMWQPHIYVFQRHGRIFLNLGVYLSYMGGSKYYYKSKKAGIYEEGPYQRELTRDARWGYGLCGGAGIGFLIRRFEIAVEGRYYFGYSDVLRNGTKYQGNPTHSPLDNINISLALYYRLSKEGIRSAPSRGVAQRMLEAEEKRAARRMERNGSDTLDTLPPVEDAVDSLSNTELEMIPQTEAESSEIKENIDRSENKGATEQEKNNKKDRRKASKKRSAVESETIKTEEDGGSDRIDSPAEDRPADSTGY